MLYIFPHDTQILEIFLIHQFKFKNKFFVAILKSNNDNLKYL